MGTSNLLAAPASTPFCGTCMHWDGNRELRDGYCITTLTAHGSCTHAANVPDATSRSQVKQAREAGCETWRVLEPEE